MKSFVRACALDEIRCKIKGVLLTPMHTFRNGEGMLKALRPQMDLLGMDVPVRCITTPTRVEHLYVSHQRVGMSNLTTGSCMFRDFVNASAGAGIAPEGDERIYILRSLLLPGRSGLIGESLLEQYLADAGYQLFHPQKHPAAFQIARYKAAREVIMVGCSLLPMLAYAGNGAQRVGIPTRRSMDFASSFIWENITVLILESLNKILSRLSYRRFGI